MIGQNRNALTGRKKSTNMANLVGASLLQNVQRESTLTGGKADLFSLVLMSPDKKA
jgi:hypothetical protein